MVIKLNCSYVVTQSHRITVVENVDYIWRLGFLIKTETCHGRKLMDKARVEVRYGVTSLRLFIQWSLKHFKNWLI